MCIPFLKDIIEFPIIWRNWGWRFDRSSNLSKVVIVKLHLNGWSTNDMNIFQVIVSFAIRVVKSRDCLYQSNMGLCVTNHDNPRMIGCRGKEIRSNPIIFWWDLIVSSIGIISSMMAPDKSGCPSITSTRIGFVLMTLGMEFVWPTNTSIKHVVPPKSSRVMVHITWVPICKLTSIVKPFRDGASWVELII